MNGSTDLQGRRENSKAPEQKRKMSPPAREAIENSQDLEISFGKLLLVYFMRPPDLEAFGARRPLGACSPGDICPPAPLSKVLLLFISLIHSIFALIEKLVVAVSYSMLGWNAGEA